MGRLNVRGGVIVLVAAAALSVVAVPADARFSDVASDAYYEDGVAWLLASGLTTGTGPGCFEPDRILTRAEVATFLHRLAGAPAPSTMSPFTDVEAAWALDAVSWLAEEGITTGVGGARFAPDEPVTRGQFAAFLYRYEGPTAAPPHGFTDVVKPWPP